MRKHTRILALLLSAALLVGLLPTMGFASFSDVGATAWYADAVRYVSDKGLMNGSGDSFDPDGTTTRAMIVTILHRLEGEPAPKASSSFADVEAGAWYAEAVAWAAEEGIVNGYGTERFAPNDVITREQFATVFYRYAEHKSIDVSEKEDLSQYHDAEQISAWAKDAMAWAVATGLIGGVSETLIAPAGHATRAQAATILVRLDQNVLSGGDDEKKDDEKKDDDKKEEKKPASSGGGGGGGSSSTPTTYTVTFDSNGGTEVASQSVTKGKKAAAPENPTKASFTFVGWYKDAELSESYDFDAAVTESLTLYAKWTEDTEDIDVTVTLTASVNELWTDDAAEDVCFYAEVMNDSGAVSSVVLYDSSHDQTYPMFDDGQYTANGDELSGDGVYTCRVSINKQEEHVEEYQAEVTETEEKYTSNTVGLHVVQSITETQLEGMDTVDEAIAENVFQLAGFDTMTAAEKQEAAVTILKDLEEQNLISENSIVADEDGEIITFQYESGALGAISLKEWNEELNGAPRYEPDPRERTKASGIARNAVSNEYLEDGDAVSLLSNNDNDLEAIILWSFDQAWDTASYREPFYSSTESDWESKGVDTTVVWNTTVASYKSLSGYDFIVLSGHGAYHKYSFGSLSSLLLHEEVTKEKNEKYKNDLKLHNVATISVTGGTMYAILPDFWQYYYGNGELDGAFLFAENCEFQGKNGNVDTRMMDSILSTSVEAVIGFHNSVMADYSRDLMKEYIDNLIEGESAGAAFSAAKAKWGSDDYFEGREGYGPTAYPIFGGNQSATAVYEGITNGSFESEITLSGWKHAGDTREVVKLGALTPQAGKKMAIITTGIGSGTQDYMEATEGSVIRQKFRVPTDKTILSFSYDVVSEEPMEYVGSQYDDKFKVVVKTETGQVITVADESVNGSNWLNIDDIDFDGGDETTYHTGWKDVYFDLADYAGESVTVQFVVYDVGDSVYDTAVLLDNIRLIGASEGQQ